MVGRLIRRRVIAAALSLLAVVQAKAEEVVTFEARASRLHDDNLFRLSDGVDASPVLGTDQRADDLTQTEVALAVDKTISLQRLRFDIDGRDVRYGRFSVLDHRASRLSGEWLWSLGDVLTGRLGTRRDRLLTGFADFRPDSVVRNLETRIEHVATLDWRIGARWHLDTGATHRSVENSTSARQSSDYRSSEVLLGLRYVDAAGREASVRQRESKGEYPNRLLSLVLDNTYAQRNTEASVRLPVSGASRVHASLGRVDRSYDEVPQRDYAGSYGHLGWDWDLGGKSSLRAMARRDLTTLEDFRASFQDIRTLSLMPTWAATDRLMFRAKLERSRRSHEGDPGFVASGQPARVDRIWSRSVSGVFDARRWLELSLMWLDDRRDSNADGVQYQARSWSIGVTVQF